MKFYVRECIWETAWNMSTIIAACIPQKYMFAENQLLLKNFKKMFLFLRGYELFLSNPY